MSLGPYKHKFTALWALYKNTPSRLLRYFHLKLCDSVTARKNGASGQPNAVAPRRFVSTKDRGLGLSKIAFLENRLVVADLPWKEYQYRYIGISERVCV